jgi:hypothetical protein
LNQAFHPKKLNADDAKVSFYPVYYVVFNGMKENKTEGLKTSSCWLVEKDRSMESISRKAL